MSQPDSDYVFESLVRYNYFPLIKEHKDEIPPVFDSESLTPEIAEKLADSGASRKAGDGFDSVDYRTIRFNNTVRAMSIPHPYPYARLCQTIRNNWSEIEYICTNENSQIKPERHGKRVVVMGQYYAGSKYAL